MTNEPTPSVSDWNWAVLSLVQALVGSISPNVRLVQLDFDDGVREDNDEDREEIAEACVYFLDYMDEVRDRVSEPARAAGRTEVSVSDAPIYLGSPALHRRRTVFRQREAHTGTHEPVSP